jgi:hypothetical protein
MRKDALPTPSAQTIDAPIGEARCGGAASRSRRDAVRAGSRTYNGCIRPRENPGPSMEGPRLDQGTGPDDRIAIARPRARGRRGHGNGALPEVRQHMGESSAHETRLFSSLPGQ